MPTASDPPSERTAPPIVWDTGGSTAIPSAAMVRGRQFRECILCGATSDLADIRGMVCFACRSKREDDVIELVPEGEALSVPEIDDDKAGV